jgi:MFS family permease
MTTPNQADDPASSVRSALGLITNRHRWSIVVLLLVASMINYFDRSTISFSLPLIAGELHLGPAEKGIVLSAFYWSYAAMQIPMGLLADRFNLRWIYAAAFALWSLAQGLTGLAASFGMLICFRVLLGTGEAIYLPGGTKTVSLLFPLSERGFPCGLFDFGTRTGIFLEGLLLPWLILRLGWRTAFCLIGFSALVWLVPWLLVAPKRMYEQPETEPNRPEAKPAPAEDRCRRANLVGICIGFFCFDYYWYLLFNWLPDYLQTVRHLSMAWAGVFASAPFLFFGICQPLGGWLGDRLARAGWNETYVRKGLISLAFTAGLFLIPAARASSVWMAFVLITCSGLVGLSTANQLVILQSWAPPGKIGYWTGIYNLAGNIGGILAPLVTGYLIKWTGSYSPAFVLAGGLIAVGQFSYWFLVGEVKPQHVLLATAPAGGAPAAG